MTNVDELFKRLVEYGQYPVETSDTITILEKIGHFLDEENESLYRQLKKQGFTKRESTEKIAEDLNVQNILTTIFSLLGWWIYALLECWDMVMRLL